MFYRQDRKDKRKVDGGFISHQIHWDIGLGCASRFVFGVWCVAILSVGLLGEGFFFLGG